MGKKVMVVYWIEAGSGNLRSERFGPSDARSGSYRSEVIIKYAVDPIEITEIPVAQEGNDWARAAVVRLRAMAEEIRASKSPTA